jgi:hypothetical protein
MQFINLKKVQYLGMLKTFVLLTKEISIIVMQELEIHTLIQGIDVLIKSQGQNLAEPLKEEANSRSKSGKYFKLYGIESDFICPI